MTAKSVLNSSVCVSIMANNLPVVVTGVHMGNVGEDGQWVARRPYRKCRLNGGSQPCNVRKSCFERFEVRCALR